MTDQQQKVCAAALCGLLISAAGAFAVQPALTGTPTVERSLTTLVIASAPSLPRR